MKIGIIYDLKDDYTFDNTDVDDFTDLEEITNLTNILVKLGHSVNLIHGTTYLLSNIEMIKNNNDILINMTEGYNSRNREGLVAAFLELNKIRYIGSDCYAGIVTLDKYLTKLIAKDLSIPTPDFALYLYESQKFNNPLPTCKKLVLKPAFAGSSDGIQCVVNENVNMQSKIKNLANKYTQNILVEEYIDGYDISISAYGNSKNGYDIIGAVITTDLNGNKLVIYDKKLKNSDKIKKSLPIWTNYRQNIIYNYCLSLAENLALSGFFRFDFRINDTENYFLEINALPSLLQNGSFIKAIDLNGKNKYDILQRIIENENNDR